MASFVFLALLYKPAVANPAYAVRALVNMPARGLARPLVDRFFNLLLVFSPNHAFGRLLYAVFPLRILSFTFEGLVVGSVLFNTPFNWSIRFYRALKVCRRKPGPKRSFMLGRPEGPRHFI